MEINSYVIIVLISTLLSGTVTVYLWQRREATGAASLAYLHLSTTIWSLGYLLELAHIEKEGMIFWLKFEYLGISFMSLWCVRFGLQYTGYEKWLTRKKTAALCIIPFITLILNWTNEWHHLFYSNIDVEISNGIPVLALDKGTWYWVHIANFYTSFASMAILLLRMCWRRGYLYRRQALAIFIGTLIPCIGNVLYLTNSTPFPHLDLSPFAIALMGVAMILGLFRYRMFNIVPIARDVLIENMSDGVLVLNTENHVIDINPAATQLLNISTTPSIGKKVEELISDWPEFLEVSQNEIREPKEIVLEHNDTQYLDLHILPLTDAKGQKRGKLITLRDMTARKQLESEREELIQELQEALAHVKNLSGLLPICASCKKIRDDEGDWHQVDVYVRNHTEVEFSHGICPECIQTLYPEYRGNTGAPPESNP